MVSFDTGEDRTRDTELGKGPKLTLEEFQIALPSLFLFPRLCLSQPSGQRRGAVGSSDWKGAVRNSGW